MLWLITATRSAIMPKTNTKNTYTIISGFMKSHTLMVTTAVVLFGAFLSVMGMPKPASGQESSPQIPESTVIRISNDRVSAIKRSAEQAKLEIGQVFPLRGDESLVTLEARPSVTNVALSVGPNAPLSLRETEQLDISPNYTYEPLRTPNDTNYSDQWDKNIMDAPKTWDITTGSADTVIAIVDSGVLFNQQWNSGELGHDHSDMDDSQRWVNEAETSSTAVEGVDDDSNGFVDDKYGWDFKGGYADSTDCPNDENTTENGDNGPQPYSCDKKGTLNKKDPEATIIGHGTSVASQAAAATDNGTLIAGNDWNTKIMNLRVFGGYGEATTASIVSAVDYAANNGADAINLSLAIYNDNGSCDITDTKLEEALKSARNQGVVTAAASGNGNEDHVCYPASSPHTLAVGASTEDDERAGFSNYGDELDLIAPGKDVPALNAPSDCFECDREYISEGVSGTSLATPHVTGAASLLTGMFPDATFNQVRTTLQKGVDNVPQMNGRTRTDTHGHGRLNLHKTTKHADTPQPDGMLVSVIGSPHIYWLENGEKHRVLNPAVLKSHNFKSRQILRSTLKSIDLSAGSPLRLREGTLVQSHNDTKIFIVDHESDTVRKRHIGSPSVFNQLGFTGREVMTIKENYLPDENGPSVSSAEQHPDGVLISPDGKPHIYLVEGGQRRYIPNPPALKSHHFLGGVKEATADDMNLNQGDSLNFREGTLIKDGDPPIYVVNYATDGTAEKRHIKTLFIYHLLELGSSKVFKVSSNALPAQDGDPIK